MREIKDMTCNGKCSRCGECCGLFIPFTDKELNIIKQYVKEHNIQPTQRVVENGFIAKCCFYENGKCNIYEVRPYVCRDFICSRKNWKQKRDLYEKHGKYNSTLNKPIMATFDDKVYNNYEPIIRYILGIISQYNNGEIDHRVLIAYIKSMNRLDLLNYFSAYDENGKKYDGTALLNM